MNVITIKLHVKIQYTKNFAPSEKYDKSKIPLNAVTSSTKKYLIDIGRLHARHLPKSIIKLTKGTLSNHEIGFSQKGQKDLGRTMDLPKGSL